MAVVCMSREFPDKNNTKIVVVHAGDKRSNKSPKTESAPREWLTPGDHPAYGFDHGIDNR